MAPGPASGVMAPSHWGPSRGAEAWRATMECRRRSPRCRACRCPRSAGATATGRRARRTSSSFRRPPRWRSPGDRTGPARLQVRRLLDRGLVRGVCLEVPPPARERARAGRVLDGLASRPPSDTGTLVMVARPPPAGRRVAVLEAMPVPETTVVIPPRTARAPSDAPAPAALPPMLAPAPTADPIVRTTASAGLLTTAGVFSCQTRTPYPATAPSNPATTHSSISPPPPPESHLAASTQPRWHRTSPSLLPHHPDRRKSQQPGRGPRPTARNAAVTRAGDTAIRPWWLYLAFAAGTPAGAEVLDADTREADPRHPAGVASGMATPPAGLAGGLHACGQRRVHRAAHGDPQRRHAGSPADLGLDRRWRGRPGASGPDAPRR